MLKKQLKDLLAFVQETDLQEVRWEKKGTLIAFQRAASEETAAKAAAAAAAAAPSFAPADAPKPEPALIRSTMVGTFYRADTPDRPPFVVEGTAVTAGQPVGAIEAMKIMKDVLAPGPCKIIKAL